MLSFKAKMAQQKANFKCTKILMFLRKKHNIQILQQVVTKSYMSKVQLKKK